MTGALATVDDQLKKYLVDIVALQEVRWPGSGTVDSQGYTLFYSGHAKDHVFGTGFMVSRKWRQNVIEFKPVDERMCVLRIKGSIFNISIICVHAPTEEKEDEIKEQFYDKLDLQFDGLPKADMKIVVGDFNAKIGREAGYFPTIGKYSLHDSSNNNGSRTVEFAASHGLVVKSTWFQHKNIHKATWISPDGVTRNQIDHVLIEGRHFSSILDVRSFRGADCDSDHMLVVGKLRTRISNEKKIRGERKRKWDVEKLSDVNTESRYQTAIEEHIRTQGDGDSVETLWTTLKSTILAATEETVGYSSMRRGQQWFDDECTNALNARNIARQKYLTRCTRRTKEEYAKTRKEVRKTLREKKRACKRRELQELQEHHRLAESRKFYRGVNAERKSYQPRVSICKDMNGIIVCEKEAVINRWAEYFENLLNVDSQQDEVSREEDMVQPVESDTEPPSLEEVRESILSLKNNKAPGGDNICAEMLKRGGEALYAEIHKLIARIWIDEVIPEDWNVGIICPLYKKGDRFNCANYRGITLLSVVYKVLSTVLLNRIKPFAEKAIGEYQCGFRSGRSTTDQIFNIRQIMERMWEFGIDIHQLFVDFKQAYDSINRSSLWGSMAELGIPSKYIRLVKATMVGSKSCVRVQGDLSKVFEVSCGLRQGDGLSPVLFNLALEKVFRMARIDTKGTIFHKSKQVLAYADDIDIVGRSETAVKETFKALEESLAASGLQVNEGKTKYMVMSRRTPSTHANISINNYNFEVVKSFEYLGTAVNTTNNVSEELKRRVAAGNRCLFGLASIFRSKDLRRSTKLSVYKTLLRPVVLYGCEAWTLTQAEEQMLGTFERKVLRRIFGPVPDPERTMRIRYNFELKALFGEPDIVAVAKSSRLRWAGHLMRMKEDSLSRRVFQGKMYGQRPQGRPRKRWCENIEDDLDKLGVRDWKTRAQNRTGWRTVVEEAKTHLGL